MTDWKNRAASRLSLEQILAGGFSTSFDAPTVPSFPFSLGNTEVLLRLGRSTLGIGPRRRHR